MWEKFVCEGDVETDVFGGLSLVTAVAAAERFEVDQETEAGQVLLPAVMVQVGEATESNPVIFENVAVTFFAEVIATVQVFPEEISHPDQLEKIHPSVGTLIYGVAVRVTPVL